MLTNLIMKNQVLLLIFIDARFVFHHYLDDGICCFTPRTVQSRATVRAGATLCVFQIKFALIREINTKSPSFSTYTQNYPVRVHRLYTEGGKEFRENIL